MTRIISVNQEATYAVPAMLSVFLHYHYSTDQYHWSGSDEWIAKIIDKGLRMKLLVECKAGYAAGPALAVYIKALCAVPFPAQIWGYSD